MFMDKLSRVLACAIAVTATSSAYAAEQLVKLNGCEFSVQLPEKPVIKKGRRPQAGKATGPSIVALIRGRVPAYRVECQGFSSLPPNARQFVVGDTEDQAQDIGLEDFQFDVADSHLGTVMEYSGIDVQAGHRFVVTGRTILGRRSVFSLIVTEPSVLYPAEETRRVLGSIRR